MQICSYLKEGKKNVANSVADSVESIVGENEQKNGLLRKLMHLTFQISLILQEKIFSV